MDELINHLMHNPENTNPNVIRDMLKGSNIGGEPNFKVFKRIVSPDMFLYIPEEGFATMEFIDNKSFIEGIVNTEDTILYTISVNDDEDYTSMILEPVHINTYTPPTFTSESWEETMIAEFNNYDAEGQIYIPNKTTTVLYNGFINKVYLTEEELENNFTNLGYYSSENESGHEVG